MDINEQQTNLTKDPNEKMNPKPNFLAGLFKKKEGVDNLELLETDLIKDEVEIKFEWKKDLPGAFVLFVIAFIIILETYLFLSWWGEKREVENSHYLEREIVYINDEIKKIEADFATSSDFKKKLSVASSALSMHIYWSNLFSYLESNTLKNVYYNSFSGSLSGEYVLPATTDDVRAISFQSKVFLEEPMTVSSEVSDEQIVNTPSSESVDENGIQSTVEGKTKVNFNLKLNLNKSILNK